MYDVDGYEISKEEQNFGTETLANSKNKIQNFFSSLKNDIAEHERQLKILSVAGAELSKEQEQSSALELILYTARDLTNADAGTVYSVKDEFYDDPFNPGELKSKSQALKRL